MVLEYQRHLGLASPLALVSFGLASVMISAANAEIINRQTSASFVIASSLFLGGFSQLVASVMEFVKGNTHNAVTFGVFAGFWFVIGGFPLIVAGKAVSEAVGPGTMALFFLWWAILAGGLYLGVVRHSVEKNFLWLSIVITFILLAVAYLLFQISSVKAGSAVLQVAGYFGIVSGLSAIYVGFAEVNGWPQLQWWPN